jgi:predicted peroxiredoxin
MHTEAVPRLLIVAATGPHDHTRASIPFHIAANGAVPGGVDCAVAFAGDAADLLKPQVMDEVRGVGIPPLRELIEKCRAHGVSFYV